MATATATNPTDEIFEAIAPKRATREGYVEGVKLVGTVSRNGRLYPIETLRKAVSLYEGVAVRIDHPKRPGEAREYAKSFGRIKNARLAADGIYGDLHYNPKHHCAGQFAWDAENASEGVGLSHDASVRFDRDGKTVVEILAVRSVDVVDGPGTTKSLFESESPMEVAPVVAAPASTSTKDQAKAMFKQMILSVLDDEKLDETAQLKRIRDLLKQRGKLLGIVDADGDGVPDEPGAATEQLRAQLQGVTTLLEQYQAKDAAAKRKADVEAECRAAGLDPANSVHVSEQFAATLLGIATPEARKPHIADRAALVKLAPAGESPSVKPVTSGGGSHVTEQASQNYDPVAGLRTLKARR